MLLHLMFLLVHAPSVFHPVEDCLLCCPLMCGAPCISATHLALHQLLPKAGGARAEVVQEQRWCKSRVHSSGTCTAYKQMLVDRMGVS